MKAKPVMLDQIECEALRDSLIVEANALREKLGQGKLALDFGNDVLLAVEQLEVHVRTLKSQAASKPISESRSVVKQVAPVIPVSNQPRLSVPSSAKLTLTEQCRLAKATKASASTIKR